LTEPVSRAQDHDAFMAMLVGFNRQRVKSLDEMVREQAVLTNPDETYRALIAARSESSKVHVPEIDIREEKFRARISAAKIPFLKAIQAVLNEFKAYWPVSERFIHYKLLNNPPLTHASKPHSQYKNDHASSKKLSELATRARIEGIIPEDAIEDPTRPTTLWRVF
jgi:hypothetical protein